MGDQDDSVDPVLAKALSDHGTPCACTLHCRPSALPEPAGCPQYPNTFRRMPMMSNEVLSSLGLVRWNDPKTWAQNESPEIFRDNVLWLLPVEWFDDLPEGIAFTAINGRQVLFDRRTSSRDHRFRMLAYGILKPYDKENP